jgi:hypothetical protein
MGVEFLDEDIGAAGRNLILKGGMTRVVSAYSMAIKLEYLTTLTIMELMV